MAPSASKALTIAFGVSRASAGENGMPGVAINMQNESLVTMSESGRAEPWLAKSWTVTNDGLVWTFELRENAKFHDGTPVTADRVARILARALPSAMGKFYENVVSLEPRGPRRLEVRLRRPSAVFLESMNVSIVDPEAGGTGAFRSVAATADQVELEAFPDYWDGEPGIERVFLRRYDSARGAWADMLRGKADMVYEVMPDALDFVKGTSGIKVFPVRRRYASEILLNIPRRPELRSPEIRRRLNAAIDREALVAEVSGGQGRPQDTPVWPYHWAFTPGLPTFRYHPAPLENPLKLTVAFPDASSFERLALAAQRQLADIGVDVKLEQLPLEEFNRRWESGDFEALLCDYLDGPTVTRMFARWYTHSARNWSHYSSPEVDAAIGAMSDAEDEAHFRDAFARYERALVDDPPAIFLTWSDRSRAVSDRFSVPGDPTRDVVSTIRSWRYAPVPSTAQTH